MNSELFKTYKRRTSLVDAVRFTEENKEVLLQANIIYYDVGYFVRDSAHDWRDIGIGDYIAVDTKPDTFYPINAEAFDKLYETD